MLRWFLSTTHKSTKLEGEGAGMENDENNQNEGEFIFPEEIMHHIQSFMWDRCCARATLLLSKSWYRAWSTRPTLNLSHYELGRSGDGFREFARKTMQRYEALNLRIQTLCLRTCDPSLAHELIAKAIGLGAIHLRIENTASTKFLLPDEVLDSRTLASLCVHGVTVDLQKRKREVNFSKLKSLALSAAGVKGDLFRDLIARCPRIEELTLFHVYRRMDGVCIKNRNWSDVRICSPSLERLSIRLLYFSRFDAEFDVPNIRRFEFKGSPSSRLDFKTTENCWEWESDVFMEYRYGRQSASWFSSLNMFVKMLSSSRVSLSINVFHIDPTMLCSNPRHVGDELLIPLVENLKVQGDDVTPAFLHSLFWSCRPKFVRIIRNRPELFIQLREEEKAFSIKEFIVGCFKV